MGPQKNLEAIKQKGFEEGIEQGVTQVAKRMIGMGMDNSAIAAATNLPDKIEQLRKLFL